MFASKFHQDTKLTIKVWNEILIFDFWETKLFLYFKHWLNAIKQNEILTFFHPRALRIYWIFMLCCFNVFAALKAFCETCRTCCIIEAKLTSWKDVVTSFMNLLNQKKKKLKSWNLVLLFYFNFLVTEMIFLNF